MTDTQPIITPCYCGTPAEDGVVHRTDGPCYMREPAPAPDLDLDTIQARADAATAGPWYPQTDYGNDFIATQLGGYEHGVGWLNFGAGSQARADREFVIAARADVPALLDRVREQAARIAGLEQQLARLQRDYAAEERFHSQTIAERDSALAIADKLAAALAPADVLGEHSSHNDPWQNALDWALGAARDGR